MPGLQVQTLVGTCVEGNRCSSLTLTFLSLFFPVPSLSLKLIKNKAKTKEPCLYLHMPVFHMLVSTLPRTCLALAWVELPLHGNPAASVAVPVNSPVS